MRSHEFVLERIEANLRDGTWGLGERLPGERALAEQYGVSRPSVREAVRVLEAMGIVRTNVGSGPNAGAQVIDRPAAGLGAAVRLHIASGTLPVDDVVATRALLEVWATAQAARRVHEGNLTDADHEQLAAAREALTEMGDGSTLDVNQFLDLDELFHMALVRVGGNQLVEAILGGLRSAVGLYIAKGAAKVPDWHDSSKRLCKEHGAIFEAVMAGDIQAAESITHNHIWEFFEAAGLAGD